MSDPSISFEPLQRNSKEGKTKVSISVTYISEYVFEVFKSFSSHKSYVSQRAKIDKTMAISRAL